MRAVLRAFEVREVRLHARRVDAVRLVLHAHAAAVDRAEHVEHFFERLVVSCALRFWCMSPYMSTFLFSVRLRACPLRTESGGRRRRCTRISNTSEVMRRSGAAGTDWRKEPERA